MAATSDSRVEALVRRDRSIVAAALAAVIVLAWAYTLAGAGMGMSAFDMTAMSQREWLSPLRPETGATDRAMESMPGMAMPSARGIAMPGMDMMQPPSWTPAYATVMFLMWWIMMVAMMLPSAAPMILLFSRMNRVHHERHATPFAPTAVFAAAYLVVWAAFSLVAVGLQWVLGGAGLISPHLVSSHAALGTALLLAAGFYQLTPLKQVCLRHCRSPAHFIAGRWRQGTVGAFRMGIEHGVFCVACCWFLMALLFFGGVMNLWWIAGLALFVLTEKLVPNGELFGRLAGIALIVAGLAYGAVALAT